MLQLAHLSLCGVLHVFSHLVNLGRRGRDEHRQLLEPLEAHLLSDVVVIVSFDGNVHDNDDYLRGDQTQNDNDDDGENSHSCNKCTNTVFIICLSHRRHRDRARSPSLSSKRGSVPLTFALVIALPTM